MSVLASLKRYFHGSPAIPSGYLWGRTEAGDGKAHPISIASILRQSVQTVQTSGLITPTAFANPSATAGPAAINGSATTAMRSDAAPAVQMFGSAQAGLVPLSGGGTANFLRADGTWAAPPTGGGGPPGTEYWDFTRNYPAQWIIQSDFLTVDTPDSGSSWSSQLSHGSKSSGKLYFEIHFTLVQNYWVVGMMKSGYTAGNLNDYLGDNSNSWGIDSSGAVHTGGGGSSSGSVPSWATGDIIGVAVDMTTGPDITIAFYKNNVLGNTITTTTVTGAALYLGVSAGSSGNNRRCLLATTAAQCTYSPPAGFSNWN